MGKAAEKRKARRQEREDRRARNKDRRNARRMARRQQKFDFKLSKIQARQQGHTDRVRTRVEGRVEKVKARQEGKTERVSRRMQAKEKAYEMGIDPDAWKADIAGSAADAVGSVASIFGGKKKQNMPDFPPMGDIPEAVESDSVGGMNPLIFIIGLPVLILGAMFFFLKPKKHR